VLVTSIAVELLVAILNQMLAAFAVETVQLVLTVMEYLKVAPL